MLPSPKIKACFVMLSFGTYLYNLYSYMEVEHGQTIWDEKEVLLGTS
jgi:hypothetical protein